MRSHLVCYTNNTYDATQEQNKQTFKLTHRDDIDLGSSSTPEGFQIHANLQAFRLHDTYAADLTFYLDDTQDINISQLQFFQPKSLIPTVIKANLGQTLWLYGEVDETEDECEELAKKCAIALLAGTPLNPVLENQGKFFDSLLFEFQAIHPNSPQDSTQNSHIVICLNYNYRQSPTIELASKGYNWLLELLCCYHKIRFLNFQVSQRYREARKIYSQLEKQINHSSELMVSNDCKTRLENLKSDLTKLPKDTLNYNQCLSDIQAHQTALTTNIKNYEICLNKLAEMAENPEFWQNFLKKSRDRDLLQIQTHLNYLSPKQAIFQQVIDTIRGTVEIEQAEIDRHNENAAQNRQNRLEIFLTVVSTGLAVSGISSQVIDNESTITILSKISLCPSNPQPQLSQYPLCSFSLIGFHLFLGILLAIPVAGLVWLLQNLGLFKNKFTSK